MMITTEGIIIQIGMSDVRTMGRITSGVKVMNLDEEVKIAKIAKVRQSEGDEDADYEGEEETEEEVEE